ncbi:MULTISPECIES: flavin reductase family protein [unclassified Enterococcus]|uniref:flavin reductase family protein n=1 Tax=unclassified Enterococcus TaxID=2608891 RepID=UPI001907B1E2|nr:MULTISPECIES: flavin reductase family protein [unclassified Enterococcus]MBK0037270.1 flavin reductase family protein [Enterococcus sp. S52]MBK0069933.1 flavin reductase family protein [Enterococcus sp. S53]MBK0140773.1 flavin reductase family protein [Enterococcus sp. S76]MBK0144161.1 flavin reductase family protein [Enterococcus sp. S77]
MHYLDPKDLTQRENYKLLIGSIIPRPVAVVSTQSADGIANIAPFSFFNIVSSEPVILSLAIQRKEGELKDTARNLLATKEAVVHILDQTNVQEANKTAALLPADQSELTVSGFTTTTSKTIAVPGLKEANVRLETTLHQHVPIKKDQQTTADLLLLEVVGYQIAEDVYQDGKIDPRALQAVSRLAGNSYATIGEIFDIKRPS